MKLFLCIFMQETPEKRVALKSPQTLEISTVSAFSPLFSRIADIRRFPTAIYIKHPSPRTPAAVQPETMSQYQPAPAAEPSRSRRNPQILYCFVFFKLGACNTVAVSLYYNCTQGGRDADPRRRASARDAALIPAAPSRGKGILRGRQPSDME